MIILLLGCKTVALEQFASAAEEDEEDFYDPSQMAAETEAMSNCNSIDRANFMTLSGWQCH